MLAGIWATAAVSGTQRGLQSRLPVTADNRRFATDVLHPRTMQFLPASADDA